MFLIKNPGEELIIDKVSKFVFIFFFFDREKGLQRRHPVAPPPPPPPLGGGVGVRFPKGGGETEFIRIYHGVLTIDRAH